MEQNKEKNYSGIKQLFRTAHKPSPEEKVDKSGRVNWGEENLYPQNLIGWYYDNPIHGGIINQKVKFITAGGISVEGVDESVLNNGTSIEDLGEVIEAVALDGEIGDTTAFLFKKTSDKWVVEHIGFELLRATEDGIFYEYSEDWSKVRQSEEKTGFKRYKSIHKVDLENDHECVMVNISQPKQRSFDDKKVKGLTANYYPVVNYSGAITDILAGIEMSYFTFAEVVNGWKGGTFISLGNGVPDEDTKKRIERELKVDTTDRDSQGGIAVGYHSGSDTKPEVFQINGTDLDKRYEQAKKTCRDSIMVAHCVISPALFGITSESMFGSKEEMELAYMLFKANYVRYRQRNIAKPLTWALKKLNGFEGQIVFNDYSLFPVEEAVDVTQMSKEPNILEMFSKVGISREGVNIAFSKEFDLLLSDEDFTAQYMSSKFAVDLTDLQKNIITMIDNGESYSAIKNGLGISRRELSNELVNLGKLGLVDGWKLTSKGNDSTVTEQQLKVLYSYEKKPNAPDLVQGGKSREFCTTLIGLDRLYTRQEIDQISASIGRDVWSYRGGWYHNPETDRNTPSCRHAWKQNIVIN